MGAWVFVGDGGGVVVGGGGVGEAGSELLLCFSCRS